MAVLLFLPPAKVRISALSTSVNSFNARTAPEGFFATLQKLSGAVTTDELLVTGKSIHLPHGSFITIAFYSCGRVWILALQFRKILYFHSMIKLLSLLQACPIN
ncbi:hypothetical protein A7X67_17170 [Clostridium sp. W14A]|nr:hypothetical protein A7X67_17170 [Clostridium sp. W14A]